MSDYGYLNHTSTARRDEEAIMAMFAALPCESIAMEQLWSPGEKSRPVFDELLTKIRPGDALYVHSIDRLGVDVKETVKIWKTVTREKHADIVVLNDPALNSREHKELTLPQIRLAAQRAFDGAARVARNGSRLYAAFDLVTLTPASKESQA